MVRRLGEASTRTRAQLDLSENVAAELQGAPLAGLREVIEQCLRRERDWIAANRVVLAPLRYGFATVAEAAIASRAAFDLAAQRGSREAVAALQPTSNPLVTGS